MSSSGDQINALVDRAFPNISPENPLLRLTERDRQSLVSFLKLFAVVRRSDLVPGFIEGMEESEAIATDARSLAVRLAKYVFLGGIGEVDPTSVLKFLALPNLLLAMADSLEPHLRAIGKPGHKHKSFPNQLIVAASEFVRLKTGSYNDEHLAELFQPIANDVSDDLSGDAIRKRRDQMETTYPELYAEALRLAKATAKVPEKDPEEHRGS